MFFDDIQSATKKIDDDDYVIEIRLPLRQEDFTGYIGSDFERIDQGVVEPGEFLFFLFQYNDLTYLPAGHDDNLPTVPKYDSEDVVGMYPAPEWETFDAETYPYMASCGTRDLRYIDLEAAAPAIFQLSATHYTVEIDGDDGVKDADYAKGNDLVYTPTDAEGEPLSGTAAYDNVVTSYVRKGNNLYIYTQATDTAPSANDVIQYNVGSLSFAVNGLGQLSGPSADKCQVTPGTFAGGFAHEIIVDVTSAPSAAFSAFVTLEEGSTVTYQFGIE